MSKETINIKWHHLFLNGELKEKVSNEELIAIGLMGWGNCHMGSRPPQNFGKGMSYISLRLGGASPDFLSAEADEILKKREKS